MVISRESSNSLKGIAVLLILICHMLGGGFGYRIFTPLGGIGVSIFLFLSGYGLNESFTAKGLSHFWKNKLIRLLLPYILWLIILIPVSYIMYGEILWFYRYWYIEYLFIWYFLFWILKSFVPQYSDLLLLLFAISSFFIFSNIRSEQSLSFVCGVFFSSKKNKIVCYKSDHYKLIALLSLALGVVCLGAKQLEVLRSFGEESLLVRSCQLGIKFPIGLAIILFYSPKGMEKIFSALGALSLEIYLVQMPLYSFISGSFTKFLVVIGVVSILVFVLHFSSRVIIKKLAM